MNGSPNATHHMMYGLTPEQRQKVLEVMRRGSPRKNAAKNPGWWLFREPTTMNPPSLVIMRLKTGDGQVLHEEVVTDLKGKAERFLLKRGEK